jgi:AcrR family transcriptional regulator
MARTTPPGRLDELADCATRVFIENGYRRTQMSDVAEALGVAKGTLYLYVESKEALFDLALRYADASSSLETPASLPLPSPTPGASVAFVRERLSAARVPALTAALERKRVADPRRELTEILHELFALLAANRRGIKLLDRSAHDHPELAALWFSGGRDGLLVLLEEYLRRRIARRKLRPVPDIAAAARLILETTVFWAVHRHWDPHPQDVSDTVAADTIVRFVVSTLTEE